MNKLEGIKEGDTVEVSFRGKARTGGRNYLAVAVEGGHRLETNFDLLDINAPSFSIKKVERPLQVGDRVRGSRYASALLGTILAVDQDEVWVFWDASGLNVAHRSTHCLSDLERVS